MEFEGLKNSSFKDMELRLRDLWSLYISHSDRFGSQSSVALELRQKYFELYGVYRKHKNWLENCNLSQKGPEWNAKNLENLE